MRTKYAQAKSEIRKVGYANATGDSELLTYCECLDTFFKMRAMSNGMAKRIFEWAIAHEIDVFALLKWVTKDGNEWLTWSAILDNKPLELQ